MKDYTYAPFCNKKYSGLLNLAEDMKARAKSEKKRSGQECAKKLIVTLYVRFYSRLDPLKGPLFLYSEFLF